MSVSIIKNTCHSSKLTAFVFLKLFYKQLKDADGLVMIRGLDLYLGSDITSPIEINVSPIKPQLLLLNLNMYINCCYMWVFLLDE